MWIPARRRNSISLTEWLGLADCATFIGAHQPPRASEKIDNQNAERENRFAALFIAHIACASRFWIAFELSNVFVSSLAPFQFKVL